MTFTKRKHETITIKSVGEGSISTTDSTGFGIPDWVVPAIKEGETYTLELYKFNDIAGLMNADGEYLFHRTDEYFEKRFTSFLEENKRKREDLFAKNRKDYMRRTEKLQSRYKARMDRFLNGEGSEEFMKEPMGWGYELVICELAQLYEVSEGEDTPEVMDYARKHGTSGNQHDVAKAWANNPDAQI